jgi:hypothetical protein
MHGNVPVRFGRGRLDSLGNKGLAAYLIRKISSILANPGSCPVVSALLRDTSLLPGSI